MTECAGPPTDPRKRSAYRISERERSVGKSVESSRTPRIKYLFLFSKRSSERRPTRRTRTALIFNLSTFRHDLPPFPPSPSIFSTYPLPHCTNDDRRRHRRAHERVRPRLGRLPPPAQLEAAEDQDDHLGHALRLWRHDRPVWHRGTEVWRAIAGTWRERQGPCAAMGREWSLLLLLPRKVLVLTPSQPTRALRLTCCSL